MKINHTRYIIAAAFFCALIFTTSAAQSADPLPSWNEGKSKRAIRDFVTKVTKPAI